MDRHLRDSGHKEGVLAVGIDNSWKRLSDKDVREAIKEKAGKRGARLVILLQSDGTIWTFRPK